MAQLHSFESWAQRMGIAPPTINFIAPDVASSRSLVIERQVTSQGTLPVVVRDLTILV